MVRIKVGYELIGERMQRIISIEEDGAAFPIKSVCRILINLLILYVIYSGSEFRDISTKYQLQKEHIYRTGMQLHAKNYIQSRKIN